MSAGSSRIPRRNQLTQSYLLQAADLVSYVAYQAVLQDPARIVIHEWFYDYFAQIGEIVHV